MVGQHKAQHRASTSQQQSDSSGEEIRTNVLTILRWLHAIVKLFGSFTQIACKGASDTLGAFSQRIV